MLKKFLEMPLRYEILIGIYSVGLMCVVVMIIYCLFFSKAELDDERV